MMDRMTAGPGQGQYRGRGLRWWGAGLMLVGLVIGVPIAIAAGWTFYGLIAQEMLAREVVPGELTFTVNEPGDYAVFYEHRSQLDGQTINTSPQPPSFNLTLLDQAGQEVDGLKPFPASYTYERANAAGSALQALHLEQAGTYTLEAETGASGEFVLAVGRASLAAMFGAIFGFFGSCGLGVAFVVGLVLWIVGMSMRGGEQ